MTASDRADALTTLLTALRRKYRPEPASERSAIEELIHAMLLWESTTPRADRAFKRLLDSFVDLNELRVSRPDEIAEILGKTYPLADERARKLLAALEAVYVREHAVSLDAVVAAGKRDARKYLDAIEPLPPFAAARVAVLRFDGHAVPLDQRMVEALIAAGALDEATDVPRAIGQLERMVKAAESLEVTQILQAWADDGFPAMGRSTKKTTKKKAAASAEPRSAAKKPAAKKTGQSVTKTATKKAAARPAKKTGSKK